MSRPPIKLKLTEIYDANWNGGDVTIIKPTITTEAFAEGFDTPALTVPVATEHSVGETGYKWMSNQGPVQQKRGEVQVNLWVTADGIHAIDTSVNPEDWLKRARQEIGRITLDKVVSLSGYDYIAWDNGEDRHEKDKRPIIYRRRMGIKYSYKKTPE